VDAVVGPSGVDAALLLKVRIKLRLDALEDGLPAAQMGMVVTRTTVKSQT